jgi:Nitroreductase family
MAVSRRNFVLGAGGTLALVGAAGAWRVTRMPEEAVSPWAIDPAPLKDLRLDAFRYAILAPNPHNRQPWLIKLEGAGSALISCDLEKRLPVTDPFDRQIMIGFGTFIELARIAAAERGVRMEIAPFPQGESQPRLDARPVARLTFVPDPTLARDPLFSAITKRRTNRSLYRPDPPTQEQLDTLSVEGANTSADAALLKALRSITVAAITGEMMTRDAHMESVRLMRIGHAEVDATPDGLALTGPMIEATAMLGLTTRGTLADRASPSFSIGLKDLQKTYGSVPAALWITTPANTRLDQLDAGRRYARATLRAAELGLAMHPLSQSLQEYPEMERHLAAVHRLLGANAGERVQMLARVGFAPDVPPAARYPMDAHFLT